jgi:succinyl-diaminopimelate desuccinylase
MIILNTVERLKALIRIDSSTREKANEAVVYAAGLLEEAGVQGVYVEEEGYTSYVASVGSGEKTLVYNGHLDVVSGKAGQFDPVEKNGRVYGRGAADMKSGVAAMIGAMIALKKEPPACKVMIQLVPDEETGGIHGTSKLVREGYVGDFVICTEPTNLSIGIQSKGVMRLKIRSRGRPAHGSRPWEGENAILKGIGCFERITRLPILNEGNDYFEGSSVNLAKVNGGDIYNRVPDESHMYLDIRYVPHLDAQQIIRDITDVVDGDVLVKFIGPGVNVDRKNPYVERLVQSAKSVAGIELTLMGQHGSADTRFFAEKDIPAIEFGCVGADWHGDEEYVEIDSMLRLEQILIDLARHTY